MRSDPQALAAAGLLLAGSCLMAASVQALELEAAAQVTSEYTSNTLLTEEDEIGEWIFEPGAVLRATQDTASLEMDVDYSYRRRMYTKDFWQDENWLTGLAAIDWHAIEERLDFFLNNARTESTERALQTATRDNLQTVSTTEAGTRLRFQPRSADEFQIEYLFRDVHTTRTNTDSQRHNGTLRYFMGLSANRGLIAEATYSDIEYEGIFPNAEYTVATLGYRQESGPVEFELNVGYNWYERDGRGDTGDPMYAGSLTWAASSTSEITLEGSRMITDQGSGLGSGDTADETTDVNAAFEETAGTLGYSQIMGANDFSLAGYWIRQEYSDDVPLSNDRIGARFDFHRSLTRSTDFRLFADLSNRDFSDVGDDQDELRTGFRVEHRIGRSLNINWGVRYEKREAQISESYDEWVGDIQLYWTFLGASRTPG